MAFFRTSNAQVAVDADIINGALVQREFEAAHDVSDGQVYFSIGETIRDECEFTEYQACRTMRYQAA